MILIFQRWICAYPSAYTHIDVFCARTQILLAYLRIRPSTKTHVSILRTHIDIPNNDLSLPTLDYLRIPKYRDRHLDVFCAGTQTFLILILVFHHWLICAYDQVHRHMDVFCAGTQTFLILILVFHRWLICAYDQVHRHMDVFCAGTQTFLILILVFHRWLICA